VHPELAAEGGYDAIQVRTISDRTGISSDTIYRYFGSRDRLVAEAVGQWSAREFYEPAAGWLDGDTPAERRAREVTYLALTRWAPTHLDRADRISMAHGVQLRPPFCDRALVEYVYNVPAAFKRVDGVEKSLLRSAVADLLPEPVLRRKKSAYPTTQEAAYGDFVRRRFIDLATDRSAAVASLLDATATAAAADADKAPEGAFAWVERASMEMVLQLETWLSDYRIDLKL